MSGPDPRKLLGRPEATALLVVDMQNDFTLPDAPLATPRALELIPTIAGLASACRDRGFPVIFTQEMHRPDGADFGIEEFFEPLHCVEGSDGMDVVAGLEPAAGDYVIQAKRRYDAFYGTDLDVLLRLRQVENLIVTGVCTDICVLATVVAARNRDYRCFVASDAVDGTSAERHDAALLCMGHVFAYVGTAEELASLVGLNVGVAARVADA